MGVPPDEIPIHLPHITLAQVFDALRYYAEHQPEINQTIQANRVPEALVHPAVRSVRCPLPALVSTSLASVT